MIQYVCGLMFNEQRTSVALIEKKRPLWMQKKINGIGGKVEKNETFMASMVREFYEETGNKRYDWEPFLRMIVQTKSLPTRRLSEILFFKSFGDHSLISSTTDEDVSVYSLDTLNKLPLMYNLPYIIPLALNEYIAIPPVIYTYPQPGEE